MNCRPVSKRISSSNVPPSPNNLCSAVITAPSYFDTFCRPTSEFHTSPGSKFCPCDKSLTQAGGKRPEESDRDRCRRLPGVITTWWPISRECSYYHNIKRDSHTKSGICRCSFASIRRYSVLFSKQFMICTKWLYFTFKYLLAAVRQNNRTSGVTAALGSIILLFNCSSNVTFYEYNLPPMYPIELNLMDSNNEMLILIYRSTYSEIGIQCLPENTNELWGSVILIEDDEVNYLLGRDTVYFGRNLPMFQRNPLSSFSSSNIKPNKQAGKEDNIQTVV